MSTIDAKVQEGTIDPKVWERIVDYEDCLMQEQGGVNWLFPFTDKVKRLPVIPKTSDGGTSGEGSGKREGEGVGEQTSCSNYSVLNKIEEIKEKWLPTKRPVPQIQKIMRGVIIDLVAQGLTEGTFTIHDVSMEHLHVKVEVSESKSSLWHSLLKMAKNVLGYNPDCKELSMFYAAIKRCETLKDYGCLYFQPLLYTTRETIYLFLDLLLIVRDKDRFKDFCIGLNASFDISPMVTKIKNTERLKGIMETTDVGLKQLLGKTSNDSTLWTLLGIVKGIFHHYHQLLGENLSMDDICDMLHEVLEGAHYAVALELLSKRANLMRAFQ